MCALASSPLSDLVLYDCLVFPRRSTSSGYLRVGFVWSHVDMRSPAPAFLMVKHANPSTMSHASEASSPTPAIAVSVGGSCSTMAMAPPSFKQRVLMITHGEKLSIAAMQEVVQISSTASATGFFSHPIACTCSI